jgi:hypothetical protein
MSLIVPRYAARSDLSTFDKARFSLDDRVEHDEAARALYRALYRNLPAWLSLPFVVAAIFSALPAFCVAMVVGVAGEGLEDWLDIELHPSVGLIAALLVLGGFYAAAIHENPWCWLLVPACIISLAAFWFGLLMNDYDYELDRVEKKGRYAC